MVDELEMKSVQNSRKYFRVVVAREVETSSIRNERLRRQRKLDNQEIQEENMRTVAFAEGIGIRFNKVESGWIVASLNRFGRANLSGTLSSSITMA